ncbi:MAG: hypothetical protein IJS54_00350 [Desulfovibrio sp.]|nr:hypothetical protein [Desulfovibrio sp.]
MEKMLLRLAHQLDSMDEASLMALWSKYATLASRFEPTQRWEESVLVFALIQAKHWKNQLFNYKLAQMSRPNENLGKRSGDLSFGFTLEPQLAEENKGRCRVLSFRGGKDEPPSDEGT